MQYPKDFTGPRYKFIGSLVMDYDNLLLSIDFNGESVTLDGADSWEWNMPRFDTILKANGLKKTKSGGYYKIQLAARTGKYVRNTPTISNPHAADVTSAPTMQTQTNPAVLTTTEMMAEYNKLAYYNSLNPSRTAAMETECKRLAATILAGDLSGKAPLKKDRICSDDVAGLLTIQSLPAAKVKPLTAVEAAAQFTSTDELRPAMTGVYYHANRTQYGAAAPAVVGVCGHTLLVIPTAEAGTENRIIHPKTGRLIDERYPDYENVIPCGNVTTPAAIFTLGQLETLRNRLTGIQRANKFAAAITGINATILHEGIEICACATFLLRCLTALLATGSTRIQMEIYGANRAIIFRDADQLGKVALCMPKMKPESLRDTKQLAYAPFIDTAEVITELAPVAAPTRKPTKAEQQLAAALAEIETLRAALAQTTAATTPAPMSTKPATIEIPAEQPTEQQTPEPTQFASFNERKEFLGFYDGKEAPAGHAIGIFLTPAQMKKAEKPGAYARLFNKPGYGGWQITMGVQKPAAPTPVAAIATPDYAVVFDSPTAGPNTLYQYANNAEAAAKMVADLHLDCLANVRAMSTAGYEALRAYVAPIATLTTPDNVTPPPATLAALDELVRLGQEMCGYDTTPPPATPEQFPVAFIHNGVTVYHVRKEEDNPASRVLTYWFSFAPAYAAEFDIRNLAAWTSGCEALSFELIKQALDNGELTAPASTKPAVTYEQQRDVATRCTALEAAKHEQAMRYYQPGAIEQPAAFHALLDESSEHNQAADEAVKSAAALYDPAEHGAWDEYTPAERTTDELRSAILYHVATETNSALWAVANEVVEFLHSGPILPPTPTNPAPRMKKKFPFLRYTQAGDRCKMLHQIGKAAVAWIYPQGAAPYLSVRMERYYATVDTLLDLPIAFDELRRLGNARKARYGDMLNYAHAMNQLGLTPPQLAEFWTAHGLDVSTDYPRADIRRAILTTRNYKFRHYLNMLDLLTPTT